MKKLIQLVVMGVFVCCAGIANASDKPIVFVLDTPDKTKGQLFSASKSWIAETFVSGKAVIDDADKDSGRIIAKGHITRECSGMLDCMNHSSEFFEFTLRIDTKDNKVRASFSNLVVLKTFIGGSPDERKGADHEDSVAATKAFSKFTDKLKEYIDKESAVTNTW